MNHQCKRCGHTVVLPDGYNGHTETFCTTALDINGELVKLHVAGKIWLTAWKHKKDVFKAIALQGIPEEYR